MISELNKGFIVFFVENGLYNNKQDLIILIDLILINVYYL